MLGGIADCPRIELFCNPFSSVAHAVSIEYVPNRMVIDCIGDCIRYPDSLLAVKCILLGPTKLSSINLRFTSFPFVRDERQPLGCCSKETVGIQFVLHTRSFFSVLDFP